jgi:hypothetical protein
MLKQWWARPKPYLPSDSQTQPKLLCTARPRRHATTADVSFPCTPASSPWILLQPPPPQACRLTAGLHTRLLPVSSGAARPATFRPPLLSQPRLPLPRLSDTGRLFSPSRLRLGCPPLPRPPAVLSWPSAAPSHRLKKPRAVPHLVCCAPRSPPRAAA